MFNYVLSGIIVGLLFFLVGLIIGGRANLPSNFFNINLYQVISVIISLLIGVYVSYFVNLKNQKIRKRNDFIIKLCDELYIFIEDQSINIYNILGDFSDKEKKRLILLFFKTINNKIGIIKKLSTKYITNEVDSLHKSLNEYYSSITGDEWAVNDRFNEAQISDFKKNIVSCKNIIQNIIAKCIIY
jgi:hypothetical protein